MALTLESEDKNECEYLGIQNLIRVVEMDYLYKEKDEQMDGRESLGESIRT